MHTVIFGKHEESTLNQFHQCLETGNVAGGVLCADGHYGYSQPVGAVIAYQEQISPSGVGYDIACGNKAIKTDLYYSDIKHSLPKIMDDIERTIAFGVGRSNKKKVDHDLFDDKRWDVLRSIGTHEHDELKSLARKQLGTTGAGNHYVDLLVDAETDAIWIANHFGSRGFGHRTATGFLNLAKGKDFFSKQQFGSEQTPTILHINDELGEMYFRAMELAGIYAYAGRDYVLDQVLDLLKANALFEVHNHHNYAWKETHHDKNYIVVRKGATPAAPGQYGFIGGSMGDISVIVKGKDSQKSKNAFYSTVHGAGRIMSRTKAAGKRIGKKRRTGGAVSISDMHKAVKDFGVELRGGGPDESPFVYRKLSEVIASHKDTIDVVHTLKPIGVCMARS